MALNDYFEISASYDGKLIEITIKPLYDIKNVDQDFLNLIYNESIETSFDILKNVKPDKKLTFESKVIVEACIYIGKEVLKCLKPKLEDKSLYLMYSKKLDLYKIGITIDIDKRINSISKDIDGDVELIYELPCMGHFESELHKEFDHLNVRFKGTTGAIHREWFIPDESILNKFKELWTN